jgi:hypothetical protein
MNIQIFGTNKSQDTKKAVRFFKERNIKFQMVNMKEKGLSKGEFNSVMQAVGGFNNMLDEKCNDNDTLTLIKYLSEEDKIPKIFENQQVLKLPIVRNGKDATVGYMPEVWKGWS